MYTLAHTIVLWSFCSGQGLVGESVSPQTEPLQAPSLLLSFAPPEAEQAEFPTVATLGPALQAQTPSGLQKTAAPSYDFSLRLSKGPAPVAAP